MAQKNRAERAGTRIGPKENLQHADYAVSAASSEQNILTGIERLLAWFSPECRGG